MKEKGGKRSRRERAKGKWENGEEGKVEKREEEICRLATRNSHL